MTARILHQAKGSDYLDLIALIFNSMGQGTFSERYIQKNLNLIKDTEILKIKNTYLFFFFFRNSYLHPEIGISHLFATYT